MDLARYWRQSVNPAYIEDTDGAEGDGGEASPRCCGAAVSPAPLACGVRVLAERER